MISDLSPPPRPPTTNVVPVRRGRARFILRTSTPRPLARAFWGVVICAFFYLLVAGAGQAFERWMGALLIVAAALLPSYLWISRGTLGMPIFPLYALTCTWIYAFPLVSGHRMILAFPLAAQFEAALSVAGFLLIGTGVWYFVARRPPKKVIVCWMFDETGWDPLLISSLGACTALTLVFSLQMVALPEGIYSLLRAVMLAMEALCCFILSYRLSQHKLSATNSTLFFVLMSILLIDRMCSLLLINAMSLLGMMAIAHVIGARKLPWRLCLGALFIFFFLHYGKATMREKYWREEENYTVSPLQYPSFLWEWTVASWHDMTVVSEDNTGNLAERASLMHLMLYIQNLTPQSLPFLYGESYQAVLPQFVPRIFYPDKPRSHEGTYILSIYYELQTREDTNTTTIDIGLVNEAYANFGYFGMAMLGVVLGGFFGLAANWARGAPVFSFRALFAVLVLGSILQASSSASFYIATLYQAIIVLVVLTMLFMRPRRLNRHRDSFIP